MSQLTTLLVLILSLLSITYCDEYSEYYHKPTPPTPTPPTPPSPVTPPLNTQECHDNLGLLMDDQGNTLMDNSCTPFVMNEQQAFRFVVNFVQPYEFDTECLTLQVFYEDTELQFGNSQFNQWSFNDDTQEIVWNIQLSDFVDLYQCEWTASEDQYIWLCNFQVNILFMNMEQLSYKAKIQVTLDRLYSDELVVNIQKNEVIGVCCENELNIQSTLRYCTDIDCTSFLPSPLTIIRKDFFYVEHRITTPGFSQYTLDVQQVSLGDFLPTVHQEIQQPGRSILQISSNIAKPDLVLTVISQLNKPLGGRRILQQEIRDDYRVKSQEYVTIVRPEGEQVQSEEQNMQNYIGKQQQVQQSGDNLLLVAIISVSCLITIVIGTTIYCFVQRRNKLTKQQSFESVDMKSVTTQ